MSNSKKGFGISRKNLLINFAPTDEMNDFLEDLSTIKGKTAFDNLIYDKEDYKAIFKDYPEFIPKKKNKNRSYNFNSWLNEEISQAPNKGDIYEILKKFQEVPENEELDIKPIKDFIDGYIKQREAKEREEEREEAKQQGKQQAEEENKNKIAEVEQRNKEEMEKQQAEAKARENESAAKAKHKAEERTKKQYEDLKKQAEQAGINPRLKGHLRDHYIIDSPKTREELFIKVANDPELNANTEKRINKYVNYILEKQLDRMITSKTKIIKTAKLFGNDADYLSKLDPMVREAVLKYQTDMINKTITDKNNKYMLPKKYIKFEKAINNYKVNPLVLRGLYIK